MTTILPDIAAALTAVFVVALAIGGLIVIHLVRKAGAA